MKIIEINALENGAHRNQCGADVVPDGWAVIPEDMVIPETFPFVNITVEDGVVASMTAGVAPPSDQEPEPDPGPTLEERVETLESENAETKEALEMILSGVTADE